ncbi:transglycosylase family protein [Kitasatospora sp. NPDC007106]|uniref:transglycosylase family protein n=1 Tax=Kitasatospora sp. NPDC007106 TaxID=3156914 RepID=UPI0033FB1926
MTASARKKSVRALTATALLALTAPLALGGHASAASVSTWDRVAQCESGGNWSIVSANGLYYGGLQFSQSTWLGYGGSQYAQYANRATKQQQILIAEKVLASQGEGAWPHCGPLAGLGGDHADPYPATTSYPTPSSLPSGTLVKSPGGPSVKVMIGGAGLPVAGSDVGPDGYDLSRIVLVDDAAFNALPTTPPAGTVVHDQAGGASRYVAVAGAALPISAADWTADGYNTRPDMGVPSSWLATAAASGLPSGLVVMGQSGTDASRYVMVDGAALHISGAEWTADGYNTRTLMGVPTDWLKAASVRTPSNGIVLMDQSGTDASRYVMAAGAALHISADEWTADGYDTHTLMGVPGAWLATAVARPVADGTVVKNASGADPSVYVMAGGMAVPLSYADYTGLGYDKRPLTPVPGAWEAAAAARTAPSNGTLLLSPDSATVWQCVNNGGKKALTAADFGPGKLSLNDVVSVPTSLTVKLPTAR